jgi:hypothetical protein
VSASIEPQSLGSAASIAHSMVGAARLMRPAQSLVGLVRSWAGTQLQSISRIVKRTHPGVNTHP